MAKSCLILLLCSCLVLSLSCATPENNVPVNENNSAGDVNQIKDTTNSPKNVTINEQVLLDRDGIVITAKSLETGGIWGPSLKVLVENNSNKPVTVQVRDLAVNGAMIESIFSCDVVAGKKANDEITFMSSNLELAGINIIKDIEFKFHVLDTESWDTIFDSDIVFLTTSADASFVQTYDDSGFVALDKNGFKIVIKKLDSMDSFWGADIYVYIENNSSDDATIQIRDMSVNGFMIDPIFSVDVLAGKIAFDTITFMESDLSNNDIASIDNLEFRFHIFNSKSWDTLFDSNLITVTFD